LEHEELSSRELAFHIIDSYKWYISESSVYRILRRAGLITSPAHIVMSAADEFVNNLYKRQWIITTSEEEGSSPPISKSPIKPNSGFNGSEGDLGVKFPFTYSTCVNVIEPDYSFQATASPQASAANISGSSPQVSKEA
jgi:hypothetical protein